MFTPPPSPMPATKTIDSGAAADAARAKDKDNLHIPVLHLDGVPLLDSDLDLGFGSYASSGSLWKSRDSEGPNPKSAMESKRRAARRLRWTVLLVPAVLLLVGLSSRHLSRIAVFEGIAGPSPNSGPLYLHALGLEQSTHHKRAPLPQQSQSSATESTLINSPTATATTTVPQTSQTIPPVPNQTSPPTLPTPFPQPYDSTGATSNLSTIGCQNFFNNMTQSSDFRQCRPFSLLEQFSSEFIQAQTNLTGLNILLYGTCNTVPSFDTCTQNMISFASLLQTACSKELSQQNDLVSQTLLGLQSYPVMRTAGCLTEQKTDVYCYAFAVHEQNPADVYLYNLPFGQALPDTSKPTCSACAGSMFGVYAEALQAGNNSADGLKTTYENAAQQASDTCGSGYARLGLTSGAASVLRRGASGLGEDGWIIMLWGVALTVVLLT